MSLWGCWCLMERWCRTEVVTSSQALGCSSEGFPTLVLVSSMLFGSLESGCSTSMCSNRLRGGVWACGDTTAARCSWEDAVLPNRVFHGLLPVVDAFYLHGWTSGYQRWTLSLLSFARIPFHPSQPFRCIPMERLGAPVW